MVNQSGYSPDVTVNDNATRKRWFGNYFFIDFHTTKTKQISKRPAAAGRLCDLLGSSRTF